MIFILESEFPQTSRILPQVPRSPAPFHAGLGNTAKFAEKLPRKLVDLRGPEMYHNFLIHKQFGIQVSNIFVLSRGVRFLSSGILFHIYPYILYNYDYCFLGSNGWTDGLRALRNSSVGNKSQTGYPSYVCRVACGGALETLDQKSSRLQTRRRKGSDRPLRFTNPRQPHHSRNRCAQLRLTPTNHF